MNRLWPCLWGPPGLSLTDAIRSLALFPLNCTVLPASPSGSAPGGNPPASPSVISFSGSRVGPRAAMIFGFFALLALMAILAFDSVHALNQLEMSSAAVRQDYLNRERTLRDIRFSLYESGNLLREYSLVQPGSSTRDSYLKQLHDLRDHANTSLDACLRSLPRDQASTFQRLSNELSAYWLLADRIFIVDPTEKNSFSLRNLALTQRASVLSLTGEVSDINELDFRQAEAQTSRVFAQTRHRIRVVAIFACSLGLILAASTILYLSHLERQAREKYEETLRSQRELKELSKRLVDAQEQERRAISRELHDQVGQSLTALLMDLQNLSDTPAPTSSLAAGLQKIKLLAEECVSEVRNMALLLRPSMLDDLGLIAALEWQGREVSKRSGVVVDVIEDQFTDNLPEEHRTCVYRVVQEALHNCVKHAHATRVRVIVQEHDQVLALSIEDDGIGFDPRRQRGMGFLGMHERVTRLGGNLQVDSLPGHGTRLHVELPLAPAPIPQGVSS
jgi:signal transduction histidine kinase